MYKQMNDKLLGCFAMQLNCSNWLHRRLGYSPGRVPAFFCAKKECGPLDIFVVVESAALFICCIFYRHNQAAAVIGLALVGVFIAALDAPFRSQERLARARIRRGECPYCGLLNPSTVLPSKSCACGGWIDSYSNSLNRSPPTP